jgi:pimeloyl-ACP methyl ester carboxylesterase
MTESTGQKMHEHSSTQITERGLDSIDTWREQGDYFEFDGHRIFYRDSHSFDSTSSSAKPDLLLLHGFPTSSWDWRELWPALTKHFRVVCFDLIGFGLSDKPDIPRYLIHTQADIAEHLLSSLGIVTYSILAHDYGDTVAQELLARELENERDLIKSCVLLNGGLFPETHKPLMMQKLLLSPIGGLIARLASFRKFVANFDDICIQKLPAEDLRTHWELLIRANGRKVMPRLIRYMDQRVRYRERWVDALVHAKMPLRLINGLDDPISGGHMADRYEELVPNADVVGLQSIGHYPQNEWPSGVIDAALEFWHMHGIINALDDASRMA